MLKILELTGRDVGQCTKDSSLDKDATCSLELHQIDNPCEIRAVCESEDVPCEPRAVCELEDVGCREKPSSDEEPSRVTMTHKSHNDTRVTMTHKSHNNTQESQ